MDEQLLALITKRHLLDEKILTTIRELMARGKTAEQVLIGGKYMSDVDVAKLQAELLGLPFVDLTEIIIPKETLETIPKQIMVQHQVVPIQLSDDVLQIAARNPQDISLVESLQFLGQKQHWSIQMVVAPPSQISNLIKKIEGLGTEVATALAQASNKFDRKEEKSADQSKLEDVIKGAPVSRMVSVILRQAVESGASDIHIEPIAGASRVRYRIDGVLQTSLKLPLYIHPAIVSRIKVLANLKIDETRVPQDGRITQEFGGKKIDFRLSTLPVVDNEKIVMRVLDTSVGAPTLERLGFRKEHIALINEEMKKSFGMFLVTGPTGSGKSTTLLSVLSRLNSEGVNISTLEDPVEYFIEGVNQSQIRPEIGFTFASGLRALLRQDPNVIMVGEIRDKETAELGIHAALTGHLMFSTLHTNNVYGVVSRLKDMGVEPFLLSATINLAIAQRLARKICTNCKEPQVIEEKTIAKLRPEILQIPKKYFADGKSPEGELSFFHGKGCPRCNQSGYQGRVAIAEVFVYTQAARKLIETGFSFEAFTKELQRQEGVTFRQDAILKALDGLTTVEEVFRLTQETQEDV